jgi:hypothetical protein
MKARFLAKFLVALACLLPSLLSHGAEGEFEEPEVKAAFVFNLLKLVEWPAASLAPDASLRLCHVGLAGDWVYALNRLEGCLAQGHRVHVEQIESEKDSRQCQALVMGYRSAAPHPLRVEYGLLTIGESGFIDRGGMIGLVTENNRVVMEFNVESARQAGLRIPAQVLALGRRFKGSFPGVP